MSVFYPEALNQHPGDAIDVLKIFLFGIPLGLLAFMATLLLLIVVTLIKRRRTSLDRDSLQIVVREAIPIGAAFALFMPILSTSEMVGEAFAFSAAVMTVIAAVSLAWFITRRSRLLKVSRLFPDCCWGLVLTVPLFIGIAASIFSARQNAAIARRQMKTEGVILDCPHYNLCRFTFAFLGRSFQGAGKPPINATKVGDQVTVFFDADHPQSNSLENFARTSRSQMVMVPLCLVAICAIVGTTVFAVRSQSRAAHHLTRT